MSNAYPMPARDAVEAFRTMRLEKIHALADEMAPVAAQRGATEQLAAGVARLDAIDCFYFWQNTHHLAERNLLGDAMRPDKLNCQCSENH